MASLFCEEVGRSPRPGFPFPMICELSSLFSFDEPIADYAHNADDVMQGKRPVCLRELLRNLL